MQRNASYAKDFTRLIPVPIIVVVKINGYDARALIDSGSLADFMATRFADQIGVDKVQLAKPLPVQLTVEGSRSMINYGTEARIKFSMINSVRHFDIMNINDYDLILGTPFLFQHQITIGFNNSQISIGSPDPKPIDKGEHVDQLTSHLVDVVKQDLEKLRQEVKDYARDLFKEAYQVPLPPLRKINHEIPLVDPSKSYKFRCLNCPDAMRKIWETKQDAYLKSSRWVIANSSNTMPMLFLKKPSSTPENPRLRTAVDLRERNTNTLKMSSPLPDIEEFFVECLARNTAR